MRSNAIETTLYRRPEILRISNLMSRDDEQIILTEFLHEAFLKIVELKSLKF